MYYHELSSSCMNVYAAFMSLFLCCFFCIVSTTFKVNLHTDFHNAYFYVIDGTLNILCTYFLYLHMHSPHRHDTKTDCTSHEEEDSNELLNKNCQQHVLIERLKNSLCKKRKILYYCKGFFTIKEF